MCSLANLIVEFSNFDLYNMLCIKVFTKSCTKIRRISMYERNRNNAYLYEIYFFPLKSI